MEILRKITVGIILGGKPEAPKAGTKKDLIKVWGMAKDVSIAESSYGEYARFKGAFAAVDLNTHEQYQSGNLILPEPAAGMLYASLSALEEGNATVSFAFTIGVKGDPDSVTGYQYVATPLMESDAADPLTLMAQTLKIPAEPNKKETDKKDAA